jgi:hypothetical protein
MTTEAAVYSTSDGSGKGRKRKGPFLGLLRLRFRLGCTQSRLQLTSKTNIITKVSLPS